MLRQIKPKTARSKRILAEREPKAIEGPKKALFLRGTTASQVVQDAMADLHQLVLPNAIKFTKKNPIHPFEDASSLEFFSEKNDTSLLVFGSSSKKRPSTLTLARTFDHKILDMLELYLDATSFRTLAQFKNQKFTIGSRPLLSFVGTAFESPVANEWTMAKSFFTDLFKGDVTSGKIDVEGLRYIIVVSADEPTSNEVGDDPSTKPVLHLRVYSIQTKRSGQRLPRVELEEIGPRMDLRLGRMREPDESTLRLAMKKAKTTEERTKKNISTDVIGDKLGRVHPGKQDLNTLQTRKMKGLKRSRDDGAAEVAAEVAADDAVSDGESRRKRKA
ncbi:Brix-domain-containing protein [Thozetella sp. PMI_491]|nr:Brix-domain-containing protein [Thozetella sp. PMI_491]